MHEEWKRASALQRGELLRSEIAHAELTHLALLPELRERARDLRRIHQVVGPVQLININGLDAQPRQRLLAGLHDVFGGKIVAIRRVGIRHPLAPDAALGRNDHTLAHPGNLLQHVAENFFRPAVRINIRVIEEGEARVVGHRHGLLRRRLASGIRLRALVTENAPATVGQAAGLQ